MNTVQPTTCRTQAEVDAASGPEADIIAGCVAFVMVQAACWALPMPLPWTIGASAGSGIVFLRDVLKWRHP